jgi:hypothetical protein
VLSHIFEEVDPHFHEIHDLGHFLAIEGLNTLVKMVRKVLEQHVLPSLSWVFCSTSAVLRVWVKAIPDVHLIEILKLLLREFNA